MAGAQAAGQRDRCPQFVADQPGTLHLSNQAVLCGFLLGSAPCPQPGLGPWASPLAPPERFWGDIGGF